MSNDLEKEQKKVELLRVQAATAEMKYTIMQREVEIVRIKSHIEIQNKRELELKKQLDQ